jgi:hypothetical protein
MGPKMHMLTHSVLISSEQVRYGKGYTEEVKKAQKKILTHLGQIKVGTNNAKQSFRSLKRMKEWLGEGVYRTKMTDQTQEPQEPKPRVNQQPSIRKGMREILVP